MRAGISWALLMMTIAAGACGAGTSPSDGAMADAALVIDGAMIGDAAGDAANDAAPIDAAAIDAAAIDAAAIDAAAIDAAPPVDAAPIDGAPVDAGLETCERPVTATNSIQTVGLYANFATRELKSCWTDYSPRYPLWVDGLISRRWIWVPTGTSIDVSNMERWQFPVGTRVFQELSTTTGRIVETRVIERLTGTTYRFGSYVWNPGQTDATFTQAGFATSVVLNPGDPPAEQRTHDVPSEANCARCHDGEPGRLLGFSAVQLSKPRPGLNLKGLAVRSYNPYTWKLAPPATDTGVDYPIPGTAIEAAAFGGLHAACGSCHNAQGEASVLTLRLLVEIPNPGGTFTVSTSAITGTTVGVNLQGSLPPYTKRVVLGPTGLAQSGLHHRLSLRGSISQMPPIATKVRDRSLENVVQAWIEQ